MDNNFNGEDLNRAIYAMIEDEIDNKFIPGVAEQGIWIIDAAEVRVSDTGMLASSLQVLVAELTVHWPSRGGIFFVLNLPWLINAALQTLMLLMQKETQEKVQCFRGTLGQYPEIISEHFDVEYLPVEYGGKAMMMCDVQLTSDSTCASASTSRFEKVHVNV